MATWMQRGLKLVVVDVDRVPGVRGCGCGAAVDVGVWD